MVNLNVAVGVNLLHVCLWMNRLMKQNLHGRAEQGYLNAQFQSDT